MDLVIDDDQLENGQKETLLLIGAAKNGSVAHVRRILAKDNVDANERDERLFTPLMWGCANGHFKVVEALVSAPKEKRVMVNSRNIVGDTALHWACWTGQLDAVWLLLGARADPRMSGENGMLPIHYAATGNHLAVVEALLQFGEVDLTAKNDFGNEAWLLATDPTVSARIREPAKKTHCHVCSKEFNTKTFRNVCNYCREVSCGDEACSRLKPPAEGSYTCMRVCAKCVEIDRIEMERLKAEEEERERIAKLNASYTFTVKIHDALLQLPVEEGVGALLASRSTGGGPVADFVIPPSVRLMLPPRPPGMWVNIKIYVTSTYPDCHAERQYLAQVVFPALRHFARIRRIHLDICDLRCEADEDLVINDRFLEIALEAIDSCQPFSITILGERYGWVPDSYEVPHLSKFALINEVEPGSSSTTELEIKYAYLDRPTHALPFFYLRDLKFMATPKFKAQEDQYRAVFEAEDDNSRLKLKSLKEEIQGTVPAQQIFNAYPCDFDRVDKGVPLLFGLEDFGRRVFTDLWTALDVAYPKRETGDKVSTLRAIHDRFAEERCSCFRGRAKLLGALMQYVTPSAAVAAGGAGGDAISGSVGSGTSSHVAAAKAAQAAAQAAATAQAAAAADPANADLAAAAASAAAAAAAAQATLLSMARPSGEVSGMLVVGEAGVGKSALLAEFARSYKERFPSHFVFQHYVGCAPDSDDARALILRLTQELALAFNLATTSALLERLELPALRRTFRMLLNEAASRGHVVIVIDALSSLHLTEQAPLTTDGELVQANGFTPAVFDWLPEDLPDRVRLVVSSSPHGEASEWLTARYFSRQLGVGALEENEAKDIVKALCLPYEKDVDREQVGLIMRKQDSNKPLFLAAIAEELRKCRSVEEMTRAIKDTPGALQGDKGLFHKILDSLEHAHGQKVVETALAAIYVTQPQGILESDLLALCGWTLHQDETRVLPAATWYAILYVLRPQLRPPAASSGYGFRHQMFASIVRERYLSGQALEHTHGRIATLYRRICDPRGERTWPGLSDACLVALPHHLERANQLSELQTDMCDLRYLERRTMVQASSSVAVWYRQMLAIPIFSEEEYAKLFLSFAQAWAMNMEQSSYSPQLRSFMDHHALPLIDEFTHQAPMALSLVREQLKELTEEELQELAGQKKAPSAIQHILEIVLLCKGSKGSTWKSIRAAIQSPTFIQDLVQVQASAIKEKAALKGLKMLEHHNFSKWEIKLKSNAAAVLLTWAQAILHHYQRHNAALAQERINAYSTNTNDAERLDLLAALDHACLGLKAVSKSDLTELRSFTDPPTAVKTIMSTMLVFLGSPDVIPSWQEARSKLGDAAFVAQLASYDRDGVPRATLIRAEQVLDSDPTAVDPDRLSSTFKSVSLIAAWVVALKRYVRFMLGPEKSLDKKKKKKKPAADGTGKGNAGVSVATASMDTASAPKVEAKKKPVTSIPSGSRPTPGKK